VANLFANSNGGALAHLAAALKGNAGTSVTYNRPGHAALTLTATKVRTQYLQDQTYGIVREHDWDWIITAADLVLSSAATQPKKGDTIKEVIGSVTNTYEVLPSGDLTEWDWLDPHRTMMRIRTKQTGPKAPVS
jgi:hypothetical protein